MTHNNEKRYLLNTIFINDYLLFVQSESDRELAQLALCVGDVRVQKSETQWPLEALERETGFPL
jgi:hypothetical protein